MKDGSCAGYELPRFLALFYPTYLCRSKRLVFQTLPQPKELPLKDEWPEKLKLAPLPQLWRGDWRNYCHERQWCLPCILTLRLGFSRVPRARSRGTEIILCALRSKRSHIRPALGKIIKTFPFPTPLNFSQLTHPPSLRHLSRRVNPPILPLSRISFTTSRESSSLVASDLPGLDRIHPARRRCPRISPDLEKTVPFPSAPLSQSSSFDCFSRPGGSQQVGELNLIPRFMDPELLLRVGKPEKYSHAPAPPPVTTTSIDPVSLCVLGPDSIDLVLECSPRSFLSPDFVLATIDSGVATLRDLH